MSAENLKAGYEKFAPFKLLNVPLTQYTSYYISFKVLLDFRTIATAKIQFADVSGWMEDSVWKLAGKVEFKLKSGEILKKVDFNCNQENSYFVFDGTALHDDGKDAKVDVRLLFSEIVGFGIKPRPFDYYTPGPEKDICLVVDGKRFYQKKQFLCHHSAYFDRLFNGVFAEKNKDEVAIKDITSLNFANLLDAMHNAYIFREGNVDSVLLNGDRFDAPIVLERAEHFLLADDYMNKFRKMNIAEKYNLNRLQSKLLSTWTEDDAAEVSKGMDQYLKQLSTKTLGMLLKASWKKKNKTENKTNNSARVSLCFTVEHLVIFTCSVVTCCLYLKR